MTEPATTASATYVRPDFRLLPDVTADSKEFWSGGEHGELRIHRCRSCGRLFHPPAPVCFRCRSTDVAPDVVSGRATVAGFTVTHHQWFPGFPPPYAIAVVELDDQPDVRLTTNVIECDLDDLRVGMRVRVTFEHWSDDGGDVWIPLFRPAEEGLL
jgi:uncharacterized OB-fold protein